MIYIIGVMICAILSIIFLGYCLSHRLVNNNGEWTQLIFICSIATIAFPIVIPLFILSLILVWSVKLFAKMFDWISERKNKS